MRGGLAMVSEAFRAAVLVGAVVFIVVGCAGAPDSTAEEGQSFDVEARPLVLQTDADLTAFERGFAAVVEEAAQLQEALVVGSVEEQQQDIESLRSRLERWRDHGEAVEVDPATAEISEDAYRAFVDRMEALNDRLSGIIVEINQEIREASAASTGG